MQEVFRIASGPKPTSVFETPNEFSAYAKGMMESTIKMLAESMSNGVGGSAYGVEATTPDEFRRTVAEGYVWMDFISIPQTIGCTTDAELAQAMRDQARAISSIPAYVQSARNFWVCAPARCMHADTCVSCGYDTWLERGWCRMEEVSLRLTRYGDGRPLIVSQPLGEPPRVRVQADGMGRITHGMQRDLAVLTGDFSCCRLGHEVAAPGGAGGKTCIPCDKDRLRELLSGLYPRVLHSLRRRFTRDPEHAGDLFECFGRSFRTDMAFFNYFGLKSGWPRLLAEELSPPDWVAKGWSKPFEELTTADVKAWCDEYYALGWPQHPNPLQDPLGWHVAGTGNLALFRHLIEREGLDVEYKHPNGGWALVNAARNGMDSVVGYICERCSDAHLEIMMKESDDAHHGQPLGSLGALGCAAFCGHAQTVHLLLNRGASVGARLERSGRTVLHGAAEQGRAECVRLLLDAGADASARDAMGKTALDLLAETGFSSARYVETQRVLREHVE